MKTSHERIRGFTLIELLVVISVIGLLSSIILGALSSARQKGIQGAALEFATTNYHAFGANAYLYVDFNDQTASDKAGNYSWTPSFTVGGIPGNAAYSPNTPSGSGNSLNMSASGPNPNSTLTETLQSTTIGKVPYTFSFWMYLDAGATGGGAFIYSNSTVDSLIKVYISGLNSITVGPGLGATAGANYSVSLPTVQWTQITYSYDGSGNCTLYINGVSLGVKYNSCNNPPLSTTFLTFKNTLGITGLFDDIALYSQPLSAAQIKDLYAVEAPKHGIAVK